ncbi:MAG TPA: hypothetical protein VHM26_16740 [Chitinophagaceae bacterium]|jgi:hypothetical protein|nr:hypothetical protein [Chitinophagaceae bacterium]
MKKFAAVVLTATILSLASCLEMGESTKINSDGSGMFIYSADMSSVLKMAFEKKGDNEPFKNVVNIDTTVYLRDVVREMELTEESKRLAKEMMLKVNFNLADHSNPTFKFSLVSSYGTQEDLNAMASLIRSDVFSPVIEKAFIVIPGIDEKDMKEFGEMTQLLFRAMYKTTYQKGRIESTLDTTSNIAKGLGLGKPGLKESIEENMKDNEELQMMKSCNFSTYITLPVAPKEMKGSALTKGANDKQIVLKGNLLEMIKDPYQYEYSISY